MTMLLVEQNAELAFDPCHKGHFMVLGRIGNEGATRDLKPSERIVGPYLGRPNRSALELPMVPTGV